MGSRYVHTLLFVCPECRAPISASHVDERGNVEGVALKSLRLNCHVCHRAFDVLAVAARRHYVDHWPFESLP